MNKSRTARLVGFLGALGASAALVGTAVHGTGAYFTDSKSGQINASTGDVKVNTSSTTLNFDSLLPGDYKTQKIDYQAAGTGTEDIWLVFPSDGSAENLVGSPDDGSGGGLGRYGHLRITSPDGSFVSNNLSNPPLHPATNAPVAAKCGIDGNGHGGSEALATSTKNTDPGSYVDYCAPANAILLQGNMNYGDSGTATIEFGFTRVLKNGQDGPNAKLASFKIVATQHGVRPDDVNNPS